VDLTEARVSKVMKCNNCSASFDEEKLLGILMSKTVRGISARDSSPFICMCPSCGAETIRGCKGACSYLYETYLFLVQKK